MRQRDADLRVDVHDEAGAVEAARAGGAPDVRLAELLHREPDDAAVLRRGRGGNQGSRTAARVDRGGEAAGASSAAAVRAVEAARCCAASLASACGAKLRLPARLLGLQLLDLALDPGEHLLALGELALDRLLLARALGHDLGLPLARRLQPLAALLDLLAELPDVPEHLRVLVADALHHVETAEQVVEVLRAEEDLDRAAAVAVDVQRAQPLRDVRLSGVEALLRDHEMARVRVQVGVDLVELDVRVVVRLDRLLELESDSWICASTACAWSRFDWIGFAVAELTLVRRATTPSRASEARRRAGACRVLELFIEPVRSSKGTAVDGGTPAKSRW